MTYQVLKNRDRLCSIRCGEDHGSHTWYGLGETNTPIERQDGIPVRETEEDEGCDNKNNKFEEEKGQRNYVMPSTWWDFSKYKLAGC